MAENPAPGYASFDPRTIPQESELNKRFIMRGQNVSNFDEYRLTDDMQF